MATRRTIAKALTEEGSVIDAVPTNIKPRIARAKKDAPYATSTDI